MPCAEPQPDRLRDDLAQLAAPGRCMSASERRGTPGSAGRSRRRPRCTRSSCARGLGAVGDRGLEPLGELVQVVGDRQDEELLLGGEVAVDQAAGDADGLGDLLDRRVLHAALVEQRAGRGDELALARPGAVGRAGASPSVQSRVDAASCERHWLTPVLNRGYASPSTMAERGAPPKVPRVAARALRAMRSLFTPLLPDDYLELINPLWSTRELRGRIERIQPRDRRRGHRRDPARLGVGGPRARPVPAHRLRRRRRPPLARLLAHLGSRPPRRLHLDHAEARRRGQGLAVPRPRGAGRARSCGSAASRARSCCPTRRRRRSSSSAPGSGITPIMSMLRDARPRATSSATSCTSTPPAPRTA